MSIRIVIIEDEKITARDLEKTIERMEPDAEIVESLRSVQESVSFFQSYQGRVDLIFSDIQLGDGLSFEIFEVIGNKTPVIFCTAFNQYALEAFKTLGVDYLLKPFTSTTVAQSLDKFKQLKNTFKGETQNMTELMNAIKNQMHTPRKSSVIVRRGDKIIPLDVSHVALFFIENEIVYVYTFDQKKHVISQKLDELEETFQPQFFRVNRQFLLNRKAVKDASHFFNRKLLVNLALPLDEQILVGKVKSTRFIEWLAQT